MKRILMSGTLLIGALSTIIIGGTKAFFSDTETSSANTFAAGAIDLKIDNTSYYNGVLNPETTWDIRDLTVEKFFNFLDLKPGDWGEDTISFHINTNDAYLCADITLTSNDEHGINEPEALVDNTDGPGNGELAGKVTFVWWADDGDNVLENNEPVISQGPIGALGLNSSLTLALADSEHNIWTGVGGPVPGEMTHYIGKAWCFGTLTTSPLVQDDLGIESERTPANSTGGITCDGLLLGNETQTDTLTADVTFTVVQARNNDDFLCVPRPVSCEPEQVWADSVVSTDQGRRKNGTPILAERTNASTVLGAPQSSGAPYDNPTISNSFYSLGFGIDTVATRSIVVAFQDNIIVDGPGNDVRVYEVTGGTSYPDEHVKIEASQDGVTWFVIAPDLVRDAEADLAGSGLAWASYIRLTDTTPIGPFEATADGYDLDAFGALNCTQPVE